MRWRDEVEAATRAARIQALGAGQFAEQESMLRADDILRLAQDAGIGSDTDVLDLCCGVAGPGRLIAQQTGCRYLGVDSDPDAITAARSRTHGSDCRFVTRSVPPLPDGTFDVVMLLETMLAFRDKRPLIDGIAGVLRPSGRLVCTVEIGSPLTIAERGIMPGADTVWPIRLPSFLALLGAAGLHVASLVDCTAAHASTAAALVTAFESRREELENRADPRAIADLITSHHRWSEWLGQRRIEKYALIATFAEAGRNPGAAPADPRVRRLR